MNQSFQIKLSIKNKILLIVLLVVSFTVIAGTYVSVMTESKVFHQSLVEKGEFIAANIASSTKSAFWSLNWIFVENLLKDPDTIKHKDIVYAKIVKPGGEVYLADDQKYYGTMVESGLLKPEKTIIKEYQFDDQTGILIIQPVKIGKKNWHILLGLSTESIQEALKGLILNNSLWGCVFLVISMLVSLFLSYSISQPIIELSKTAKKISNGSRDQSISIKSQDEIGLLGSSFNKMIQSIGDAENALIASNERFVTVLDSVDATIYVADIDTHEVLFMNRSMKDAFGYDHIGKKCYKSFRGEERPCRICQNNKLLDEQGKPTGVISWERINPVNKRWYMNYDRAIKWIDNRMVHLQIAFDTTSNWELKQKREETEAKLRQSQKMEAIGKLAGGVAHDLNNILSGIINYPELLLLDLPENSHMRELLEEIQSSGEKAATIVDDLLTLARRGVSVNEVVDLNMVIANYLNSPEYEKLITFHPGVASSCLLSEDLKTIHGSPVHLSKMIMNLISNAAEAMPDGGEIRIETKNIDADDPDYGVSKKYPYGYVKLTISDQGIGIEKDEQEKIFEPFYTKKVMGRSGTGLGMAVVWGTMEDHFGNINLESEPGNGTVFDLYFPVTNDEFVVKASKELNFTDLRGNGETILVVDDVKEQRQIALKMLSWLGYNVETVPSGEEAVEFVKKIPVDLMVIDMIMDPGINGLETYRQVSKMRPGQPAIISSGYSESENVRKAMAIGAGQYLRKPYTIETFARAVKQELNSAPQKYEA